jgi:hypothetical protein
MLQTKKYNRTSKGGRRGLYREKRLKLLSKFEPNWLTTDAPIGKYLVDGVAQELLKSDVNATNTKENIKFVKRMREEINRAAEYALRSAKNHHLYGPRQLLETKRFFGDLREIQERINQNNDLSSFWIFLTTKPPIISEAIEHLRANLRDTGNLIKECLDRHKPVGEGGNTDWFTHEFIRTIFDLWCNYWRIEMFSGESKLFMRLIAAAWQDLGFPNGEEDEEEWDEQCLKGWLAGRVGTQFPAGVPRARADMQASAYWKGMLRASWYRNFPYRSRRDLPAEKL